VAIAVLLGAALAVSIAATLTAIQTMPRLQPQFREPVVTRQMTDAVGCLVPAGDRNRHHAALTMTAAREGRSTVVRFTFRHLPTMSGPVTTRLIYRNRAGTRGGVLTTTWGRPGRTRSVTVFDGATGRSRVIATTPVIDRVGRSITTTYPIDAFEGFGAFDRYRAETSSAGRDREWCATIGMKTRDRAFGRLHRP
jgi:hypothetical protein